MGDACNFAGRPIHFGMKNSDTGNSLMFDPAIFAAKNRDGMPAGDQMFRQKLTVRQRTVDVATGDYLKDVQ